MNQLSVPRTAHPPLKSGWILIIVKTDRYYKYISIYFTIFFLISRPKPMPQKLLQKVMQLINSLESSAAVRRNVMKLQKRHHHKQQRNSFSFHVTLTRTSNIFTQDWRTDSLRSLKSTVPHWIGTQNIPRPWQSTGCQDTWPSRWWGSTLSRRRPSMLRSWRTSSFPWCLICLICAAKNFKRN